ncbi:hypothetical protein ACFYKX_11275 [Cytobacillus sp. FJAT-54145]|uniref:Uncharacterized protein n=1 Tax=Cytobacillus spartinae TaxID=3299023 RepID=A0ABW6KAF1_9BACI
MNMFEIIHKLYEVLNLVKKLEAGYTSANPKAMLVSYENKVYKMTLEEVGEGKVEDHINTLKR